MQSEPEQHTGRLHLPYMARRALSFFSLCALIFVLTDAQCIAQVQAAYGGIIPVCDLSVFISISP
jgi:hypothetical protein